MVTKPSKHNEKIRPIYSVRAWKGNCNTKMANTHLEEISNRKMSGKLAKD
jgi:hypothetical protein